MPLIVHNPDLAPKSMPRPIAVPPPPHVPLLSKAERALQALDRWRNAGYAITPPDVRHARRTVCDACEYWRPDGNLGLGECTAPGCGCTRAKVWLATEKCPLNKWPENTGEK